jgi:carboxymethylenebutenolidase
MPTIETIEVAGSPMEVFLYRPPGAGPHPAIVMCQHIPGAHAGIETDAFVTETAERYASEGYVVAVPFIFHWWPKTDGIEVKREGFRDDWTEMDLKATVDLLERTAGVDPARIAILGHCWGGRVAWLGAATDARYAACVIFYGGRIRAGLGPDSRPAIDRAGDIRCPIAGFFGNDDTNPSPEDVDAYDAALTVAGVRHAFHRFDGAGHAFQTHTNPDRYRPEQSEAAWAEALAFLRRELGRVREK